MISLTYIEHLVDSVILQVFVDTLNVLHVFTANTDLLHLSHDIFDCLAISC